MSASVEWTGLQELREILRMLPESLAGDASSIVNDAAELAKDDCEVGYPERTGTLADGLRIKEIDGGQYGVGVMLRNVAPHAYIFEHGTEARYTDLGNPRGRMPPGRVFIPAVVRRRRQMYQRLAAMLRAHGFDVTGDVL